VPRKIAGNTGPPRKLPIETLQATALNSTSAASVPAPNAAESWTTGVSAREPENRTAFSVWPVICANAIAQPPTTMPATGTSTNARRAVMP
jgi:hypothetical protein